MIRKIFTLFLILTGMLSAWSLCAHDPINLEDFTAGLYPVQAYAADQPASKAEIRSLIKEEKKLVRLEKRLEWFQHQFQKQEQKNALGGISDPVDRWFWIWVFGWGLGLVLTIFSGGLLTSGFLGVIWFLAFIGGSLGLIMWLVKKFG